MNWGIMATGAIAKRFAGVLSQMRCEGEVLLAVASRSAQSAQKFATSYNVPHSYASYGELLADEQVEAVYIATPNNLHFENARDCLLAGKHVLCEKPFTLNVSQAQALYALAQEKGLFIMEAFWVRFLPGMLKMREVIASGEIGQVVHARSDYGFIARGERRDRKMASALGGGALLDIGIYNLGFMYMVMGSAPVSFTSSVRMNELGTDDFSSVQLQYDGGRSATIATSIGMDMPRRAAIWGSEGEITLDDFQQAECFSVRRYDGAERLVEAPFDIEGFEYQIREFSRCVAAGVAQSDVLTHADTLCVLKTMDDIRASWGMRFIGEV